jgi:hypothetical protein
VKAKSEHDLQRLVRGIPRAAGPVILRAAVVMNQEGGEPPPTAPDAASVVDFTIQATTASASGSGEIYRILRDYVPRGCNRFPTRVMGF